MKIGQVSDLTDGKVLKFKTVRAGKRLDGFVTRFEGKLLAYENRCRHLPLPLDLEGDRFYTSDGKNFICQSHNAIYEPLTGLCILGPCEGESLKALKIEASGNELWLLD